MLELHTLDYDKYLTRASRSNTGTCMNAYDELPTNTAASLSDISPQKCYDACVKTYGTTNCAGFDTRTGCQIYSFSNDVERNKITTTGNCVSSSNCGDCFVVTTEVTSDTHLWIRGTVTAYVVFERRVREYDSLSLSMYFNHISIA